MTGTLTIFEGSIIPWLHKSGIITLLMPRIFFGRKKFFAEAGKRITERIQLGPDAEEVNGRRDFFHWVRQEHPQERAMS